jgi:hypothetical protein
MLLSVIGVQFIITAVSLVTPRIPIGGSSALTLNDVLDGILLPLFAAILYYTLFQSTRGGFSLGPLLLLVARSLGSGAHSVANSTDILHKHDLRDPLGRHVFICHEYWAHPLFYGGEFGLLALYLHRAVPLHSEKEKKPSKSTELEPISLIVACLHGSVAGAFAIGTRTTPALFLVFVTVARMFRNRRMSTSAIGTYALAWIALSAAVFIVWVVRHGLPPPTFGDLTRVNA